MHCSLRYLWIQTDKFGNFLGVDFDPKSVNLFKIENE